MAFTKPIRVRLPHKDIAKQTDDIRDCMDILPSFTAVFQLFIEGYEDLKIPTTNRTVEWWNVFRTFLKKTQAARTAKCSVPQARNWKMLVHMLRNAQGIEDYQPTGFKQIDWSTVLIRTKRGEVKPMFTPLMLDFFLQHGLK
jgi:hypothetical protein